MSVLVVNILHSPYLQMWNGSGRGIKFAKVKLSEEISKIPDYFYK